MKLLHVKASARFERSLSRNLGNVFTTSLKEEIPTLEIIERDLAKQSPSFVTEEWIASAFANGERTDRQKDILSESDLYIDEIKQSDMIVISTPMYNYGMPAALKAWIDQIARVNETFSFDLARGDFPIEPTLSGKKLIVLSSSGEFGFEPGEIRESMNHLIPHIKTCAHYLGVDSDKDFYHIGIEYQEFGDERHEESQKKAYQRARSIARDRSLQFTPAETHC